MVEAVARDGYVAEVSDCDFQIGRCQPECGERVCKSGNRQRPQQDAAAAIGDQDAPDQNGIKNGERGRAVVIRLHELR